jgi:hypothetical protein
MMQQAEIAAHVTRIVAAIQANEDMKTSEADKIVQPLIDGLAEQLGLKAAHCEIQGVYEFGLVPIIDWDEATDEFRYFNVTAEGLIESY